MLVRQTAWRVLKKRLQYRPMLVSNWEKKKNFRWPKYVLGAALKEVKWWLTCTCVLYNSWMSKLSIFKHSFSLQSSHVVMASRFVPKGKKLTTHWVKLICVFGESWSKVRSFYLPELILEQSHLLMHSWWTYCRLPAQRQGWIRGLEADSSPIWQIRHRSPSSSSESSSSSL